MFSIWVGFVLGLAMIVLGILILAGVLQMAAWSGEGSNMASTMFGIVLTLYGIYRIAVSEMQRRRKTREER